MIIHKWHLWTLWYPITNKLYYLKCWCYSVMYKKTLFPTDDFHFLSHRKSYNPLIVLCPLCPTSHPAHPLNLTYLANCLAAAVSEPTLLRLLTFQVPNHMSLFCSLGRTKVSVQVRGFVCECCVTKICFSQWGVLEDHTLLAGCDCLFNIFAATLHIGAMAYPGILFPAPGGGGGQQIQLTQGSHYCGKYFFFLSVCSAGCLLSTCFYPAVIPFRKTRRSSILSLVCCFFQSAKFWVSRFSLISPTKYLLATASNSTLNVLWGYVLCVTSRFTLITALSIRVRKWRWKAWSTLAMIGTTAQTLMK
jgi:hypothetical protein